MSSESPDENEVLDLVAYVTGSKYRELVLAELYGSPEQPSTIADSVDVARSHVSRALKELEEQDLVRAHGTDSRAKLYALTDLGERVVGYLGGDRV